MTPQREADRKTDWSENGSQRKKKSCLYQDFSQWCVVWSANFTRWKMITRRDCVMDFLGAITPQRCVSSLWNIQTKFKVNLPMWDISIMVINQNRTADSRMSSISRCCSTTITVHIKMCNTLMKWLKSQSK